MAVPTLTNLDHVCITVPDLRQAVDFFVDVLGGGEVLVAGPYQDDETDWVAEHRRQHFETPWGLDLEIVEWPGSMPFEADTPARLTPAFPNWDNRA
jgi:catechol 2,3-dioxygenase-like lactoylglutathione lyase family enzyme